MHQSLLKPTVEGAATASRPTAGQACTPLSRHSAVTLAMAACTLVLLAAIVGPRQRGDCGSESALQVAQLTQAEPPDNATVAICSIMRLDPDDPQWVDGRAEDLLEVRVLRDGCGSSDGRPRLRSMRLSLVSHAISGMRVLRRCSRWQHCWSHSVARPASLIAVQGLK